jgi:hypothetical protein
VLADDVQHGKLTPGAMACIVAVSDQRATLPRVSIHSELIAGIRARVATGVPDESDMPGREVPAVATSTAVVAAEAKLGRKLHPLLRALYLEVGNGGFGPAYGLLGIPPGGAEDDEGHDALAIWERLREEDEYDPHWAWPAALLPVGHLGCGMYMCVDLDAAPDASLIWFEPNPHENGEPWNDSFIPLGGSLALWLSSWLAGTDLMEKLFEGG